MNFRSKKAMEVSMDTKREIRIRGAKEHNLQNIDLDIPRDKFVVLTGLSGSGKSVSYTHLTLPTKLEV